MELSQIYISFRGQYTVRQVYCPIIFPFPSHHFDTFYGSRLQFSVAWIRENASCRMIMSEERNR